MTKHAKIRIVVDSSADLTALSDVPFSVAPLRIVTSQKEYIDNEDLDVYTMARELQKYKGRSFTSCPNGGDWLDAFGDAEEIYCVTITGTLSGSYNAALLAKTSYEESHPGRRVFVLNSLSTGPEIGLLVDRLRELILAGNDFDTVCDRIEKYKEETGLLFMLESMKNLANNGRISPIVARMAGLLGIRVVGKASDRGELEPLAKCRGERSALETVVLRMNSLGYAGGRVRISHCFNENAARKLADLIRECFPEAQIEIGESRGLVTFYAEMGGLLVGFEKRAPSL
jgi:DegV family protein with EDD domain